MVSDENWLEIKQFTLRKLLLDWRVERRDNITSVYCGGINDFVRNYGDGGGGGW